MQALLGRITHIEPTESRGRETTLRVRFKPACVLPRRTAAPEWLKEQTLTLERSVLDPRELGRPGDSLVLSPAESAPWLAPLVATPAVASGALPATLKIELRWWKDLSKLPEFTVRANGREQTGQFTREGSGGVAYVETASFFDGKPGLPVAFEITCEKLTTRVAVLPSSEPGAARVTTPDGEAHRLENLWYSVEVSARSHGGAIASLREQGRGVDHFRAPEDQIHEEEYFHAGFYERVMFDTGWGWSEKLTEAAMTCQSTRRESDALRLHLEGAVDEGMNLRGSASYTLLDRLPILLLEREYCFQKAKDKEEDKEKSSGHPKEPIDGMHSVAWGIRSATPVERQGDRGSRVFALDGDRLEVLRSPQVGDFTGCWDWRIRSGWIVCQHPGRREALLYLFDPTSRPELCIWWGPYGMAVEPGWPHVPARPQEGVGYRLGLVAGELCGADASGAWVACRAPLPGGGSRLSIVARLRSSDGESATISLGSDRRQIPLERMLLPGLGEITSASADFPSARIDDPLDVTVAGIAGR
jgi:hypothetical protein